MEWRIGQIFGVVVSWSFTVLNNYIKCSCNLNITACTIKSTKYVILMFGANWAMNVKGFILLLCSIVHRTPSSLEMNNYINELKHFGRLEIIILQHLSYKTSEQKAFTFCTTMKSVIFFLSFSFFGYQ